MHFAPPRYPQGYPCPPSIQSNTTHIRLRQLEPGIRLPIKLGHSQTIMTSIHLPIVPSLKLLNLECFVLVVNEAKGRNSMVAYPAFSRDGVRGLFLEMYKILLNIKIPEQLLRL